MTPTRSTLTNLVIVIVSSDPDSPGLLYPVTPWTALNSPRPVSATDRWQLISIKHNRASVHSAIPRGLIRPSLIERWFCSVSTATILSPATNHPLSQRAIFN